MDYEQLIHSRLDNNQFARLLGLQISEITLGSAKGFIEIKPEHMNPINSVHGGCLFTLADVIGAAAAASYGEHITTLDCSIHYLKAGLHATTIYADAKVIKHGKKITVAEVSVTDQDGTLLTTALLTFMSLGKPMSEPLR